MTLTLIKVFFLRNIGQFKGFGFFSLIARRRRPAIWRRLGFERRGRGVTV